MPDVDVVVQHDIPGGIVERAMTAALPWRQRHGFHEEREVSKFGAFLGELRLLSIAQFHQFALRRIHRHRCNAE